MKNAGCTAHMDRVLRASAIGMFIISGLAFPFFAFIFFQGLGGDTSGYAVTSFLGYIVFLVSALAGVWRKQFLLGCFLGVGLFFLGAQHESQFWQQHNEHECEEMRADIYCIETQSGFHCVDLFGSTSSSAPSSMCAHALTSEEREASNLRKRELQLADAAKKGVRPVEKIVDTDKWNMAMDKFQDIARAIISSPNPEALDFERELMAIGQCLGDVYEDAPKGEWVASNALKRLVNTPEEKMRYMAYAASKGRYLTPQMSVAGLPHGQEVLGCAFLASHTKQVNP